MRIDPKYFNVFVLAVAVLAFLAIIYFTLKYRTNQTQTFFDQLKKEEQLSQRWISYIHEPDSVQIASFQGKVTVIYFWATWASRSEAAQAALHQLKQKQPDKLTVVAAAVKDNIDFVNAFLMNYRPDFVFVNGTQLYQDWKVPGVPSFVVLDKNGDIQQAIIGFRGPEDFIQLESLLEVE